MQDDRVKITVANQSTKTCIELSRSMKHEYHEHIIEDKRQKKEIQVYLASILNSAQSSI